MRTWPHAKVQPTGCRATTQLRRLVLSPLSIRRKCHESAMSIVMVYGVRTSPVGNSHTVVERCNRTADFAAPEWEIDAKVGGFWVY